MIELNELLRKVGIDPAKAMVMRHRPTELDLRRALRSFAADQPELYNAYQCCHGERVEKALGRAEHVRRSFSPTLRAGLGLGARRDGGRVVSMKRE